MPAAQIQTKRANNFGGTANPFTVSASFASLPSVGSFITASIRGYVYPTARTVTFSDNQGNSWATDVTIQDTVSAGHILSMGSAYVATSSGTYTVTASITNGSSQDFYITLETTEWSGVQNTHADKTASQKNGDGGTNQGTNVDTSSTAALTSSNQLVIAVCESSYNAGAMTFTYQQTGTAPSSGWTDNSVSTDSDNSSINGAHAYVVVSSTTAVRQVWLTNQSHYNLAAVATYPLTTNQTVTWVGYIG